MANHESYRNAINRAKSAAKSSGQNYFVYQDHDEYGSGRHWDIVAERFYHECPTVPESWVKAYVGADGVIESY